MQEVNYCKCGSYDEWETCDALGSEMEPAEGWLGHYRCMNCGNVEILADRIQEPDFFGEGPQSFILRTNGQWESKAISRDFRWKLADMNQIVGGYVEIVPRLLINDYTGLNTYIMIINEEGRLKSLPLNDIATKIAGYYDMIVGNAILTPTWSVD